MAVFAVPGPSVLGLAIPGDATPGLPVQLASAAYYFTGTDSFYYLQYLGPGGTLHATPGSAFNIGTIAEASGYPYVLAVPPADGRWISGSGQILYAVVLRHGPGEHPAEVLALGRAANSLAQATKAAPAVFLHGRLTREVATLPAARPSPAPVPAPRAAAPPPLEGRVHNSLVQARRAAPAVFLHGRLVPAGEPS